MIAQQPILLPKANDGNKTGCKSCLGGSMRKLYIILCVVTGGCLVAASITDLTAQNTQPILRLCLVTLSSFVAAILCASQGAKFIRTHTSPGLILAYGAALGGLGMGLAAVFLWNDSAKLYVDRQYLSFEEIRELGGRSARAILDLRPEHLKTIDATGVPLVLLTGIALQFLGFLGEFATYGERYRTNVATCSDAFGYSLLAVVASITISLCSAFAIFIVWPDIETHGWVFGSLVESFPRSNKPTILMSSLMLAAAFLCATILISRPLAKYRGSFFRTVGLLFVLVGHISLVVIGLIEFDFPVEWKMYPQPMLWMTFAVSSCFILITLLLHVSTAYGKDIGGGTNIVYPQHNSAYGTLETGYCVDSFPAGHRRHTMSPYTMSSMMHPSVQYVNPNPSGRMEGPYTPTMFIQQPQYHHNPYTMHGDVGYLPMQHHQLPQQQTYLQGGLPVHRPDMHFRKDDTGVVKSR